MADLIGHQMYVSEGLPGIWEFSSPADIQNGSIAGWHLSGDSMGFRFHTVPCGMGLRHEIYRAKTLVTYKKKMNPGNWSECRTFLSRQQGQFIRSYPLPIVDSDISALHSQITLSKVLQVLAQTEPISLKGRDTQINYWVRVKCQ